MVKAHGELNHLLPPPLHGSGGLGQGVVCGVGCHGGRHLVVFGELSGTGPLLLEALQGLAGHSARLVLHITEDEFLSGSPCNVVHITSDLHHSYHSCGLANALVAHL